MCFEQADVPGAAQIKGACALRDSALDTSTDLAADDASCYPHGLDGK